MAVRPAITTEQRRARLAVRHHLDRPVASVEAVAGDLVGLHSSDPVTVYLTARARVDGFARNDLETALYEERSLVRMLGMRRTLFVVPVDLAEVMDAACTRALAPPERRRLIGLIEDQDIARDGERWLRTVERKTLAALAARGEATANELREDVAELKLQFTYGEGTTYAGTFGISTRVLFLLATDGRIVRGRPRGSWKSSQYRWAETHTWLGRPLAPVPESDAAADLAGRWLRTFGPGTETDLKWWTGWTVRRTREALAAVAAVEVDLGGGTGYVLPGDEESPPSPAPRAAFLPGLDPTVMGWKERDWYLGPHAGPLFDSNGNAGPTVWWDGRIVGGWAQRPDGEVVYRVLEDIGEDAHRAVEAEAGLVADWLGDDVVRPRFPVPLQKELSA